MRKGGKTWVKPGWTSQKLSEYEKQRKDTIATNQAKMKALGLHRTSNSLMCSVEKVIHTSSSKKGKRKMSDRHDDEEYNPPEGDEGLYFSSEDYEDHANDGDDESFGSLMQKVAPMPPKRQSARLLPPSTPTEPPTEGAQSQPAALQHVPMDNTSTTPGSSVGSTTTKRAVRGPTRGQRTERLVARLGKLPVEVPNDCNVPVGPNASSLISELGKEVRGAAPLQGVCTWSDIDSSLKEAIIQRAQDKFDIKDYATNPKVQEVIDKICQSRYRNWKCALHLKYGKLLKKNLNPKIHPPRGVKPDDWNYMIDHVWTNEKWKVRSKIGKDARSHLPYNHTCGSRSFPATMSIMAAANDGQKPHITDFYKESHWSRPKNDWLHPTCKEKHDEFVKVRDRCSQPNAVPMSQEEMSIEVLGSRPGYLRGFGVGPKPSSSARTTAQSRAQEEELRSLREVVDSQNHQIELQNKKMEEFEAFKAFAINALQHGGFVPPGDNSSGGDQEETS